MNRSAAVVAFGFVALSAAAMFLLPIALFCLLLGAIGRSVFLAVYLTAYAAVIAWLIRVRRRRFGRIWPSNANRAP